MEAQRRRRARKFLSTLSLRRATKLAFDGIYSDSISIHALLAESDFGIHRLYGAHHRFLSTLSLRRATSIRSKLGSTISISIHALLAESDMPFATVYAVIVISIHALLAESDHGHCAFGHAVDISIHALLAESDSVFTAFNWINLDFYPRSPCGERLPDLRRCGAGH